MTKSAEVTVEGVSPDLKTRALTVVFAVTMIGAEYSADVAVGSAPLSVYRISELGSELVMVTATEPA